LSNNLPSWYEFQDIQENLPHEIKNTLYKLLYVPRLQTKNSLIKSKKENPKLPAHPKIHNEILRPVPQPQFPGWKLTPPEMVYHAHPISHGTAA
jgi:hypothetical protein